MPDPAWPCSPPEVNYLRLTGDGAAGTATTLSSGAAWQTLVGCDELAHSLSALNTAVTALNFDGLGGASSTAAVTGLNTALQLLAGWAQEKPPIVASAVSAYETAVSTMIPAEISVANRTEQAANTAVNPLVFGALTPAIISLDTVYYGEHWAQNASAGVAYGAALSILASALAVPPPIVPGGASPIAVPDPGAANPRMAAQSGRDISEPVESVMQMMQPMQAAMGVMQPASGMFAAPAQAVQSMSGLPQSMMGSLGAIAGPAGESAPRPALPATQVNGTAGPLGGTPTGGHPGAGMTSYTRPTSSFSPELSGRPTSLKPGLLSKTEFRGPTAQGSVGPGIPLPPGHGGMLGQKKAGHAGSPVTHARVVVAADRIGGVGPAN